MSSDTKATQRASVEPEALGVHRLAGSGVCVSENSIDSSMLDLLRSLDLPESSAADFSAALRDYLDRLGQSLREARQELVGGCQRSLEQTALELSHHALKLGAVNILRAAFELQNLARCGALRDAGDLVEEIEVEYRRVQQGLASVV